jgi:predicted nuclease of predicted toxin-antitoxin system
MAIRFHLDEHISPVVAKLLRQKGFDVTTSQQAQLLGEQDDLQMSYASAHGRSFVTCDDGFLHPSVVETAPSGICYCHLDKYSASQLAEALLIVAECLTEQDMKYHIEYL